MTPAEEIDKLRKTLALLLEYSPGVYPKSVQGKYEMRTDKMDGWNEGVIEYYEDLLKIAYNQMGNEYINELPYTEYNNLGNKI